MINSIRQRQKDERKSDNDVLWYCNVKSFNILTYPFFCLCFLVFVLFFCNYHLMSEADEEARV